MARIPVLVLVGWVNMKVIVLLLFVAALAFTPVYMLDHFVMPDLGSLKDTYGGLADDKAVERLAGQAEHSNLSR